MFSRLIGNNDAAELFRRMLNGGRVPHSLLMVGPEGVGKRQFAIELACALVCTQHVEGEGCGKCSACIRARSFDIPEVTDKNKDEFKRVFLSEHPDVLTVVRYKQLILVDAIRDLEREAYFRPYEAKARVFIIDEADRFNDNAANALLKTLEEPAETSYIILISSRPDMLLQTIRSRCQVVRFSPVAEDEIGRFLMSERQMGAEDAALAARLARGSIGAAAGMDLGRYREIRDKMLAILEDAAVSRDLAALLRASEQLNDAKNKDAYEEAFEIFELLVRDCWLAEAAPGSENITNSDISTRIRRIAETAGRKRLAGWVNEIDLLRQSFTVNINRKIATDALFVKMAA
jgi:DNA polymerase III subunit delta'